MKRLLVLLATAMLIVAACGGGSDSDDSAADTTQGGDPTTGATASDEDDGDGDGDLDPEDVDPCVFEVAELETLRQLNAEAVGDFGTLSGGIADAGRALPSCNYTLTSEETGESVFSIVVISPDRGSACFVEHRGVCFAPGTTFGAEVAEFDVPDEITRAVTERLDAG